VGHAGSLMRVKPGRVDSEPRIAIIKEAPPKRGFLSPWIKLQSSRPKTSADESSSGVSSIAQFASYRGMIRRPQA
jgi:hypothetical protein